MQEEGEVALGQEEEVEVLREAGVHQEVEVASVRVASAQVDEEHREVEVEVVVSQEEGVLPEAEVASVRGVEGDTSVENLCFQNVSNCRRMALRKSSWKGSWSDHGIGN